MANQIRRDVVEMIYRANAGHPGGSLSCVDLVTALYFAVMRLDPKRPDWPDRDRFIMSKGHGCPTWYAALAHRGFFPREELWTLRQHESILQGHPDMNKTPGVDMTSGSLGHGLSAGLGMAIGAKLNGQDFNVYVLLGDGELQEGLVWEAAMAAAQFRLDNLVAIIDYNGLQLDGTLGEVVGVEPLVDKWRSFGWTVFEIDGHDMEEILSICERARKTSTPVAIIAHTVKGKGVSYMEHQVGWHGAAPNEAQFEQAMAELDEERGLIS
ncbi:MAG: transketolase [Firmicutes bacterium]|jgi:transketolase|nr:transketolase [Bacillota bacterium]